MPASDAHAYSSRWARLMPIAFITYSLAYVDRANYSFGAAGGMAHDLNIDAAASSLLGALFFLGYFFFQVPAAYYAEKRSAKELIIASHRLTLPSACQLQGKEAVLTTES